MSKEQLSEFFWPHEFQCKDRTPVPDALLPDLSLHCKRNLDTIRRFINLPIRILSGYRTASHNAAVGGASKSYHVYTNYPGKFATDLIVPGWQAEKLYEVIRGLIRIEAIEPGGLTLYVKQNFVHYDNRGYYTSWVTDNRTGH